MSSPSIDSSKRTRERPRTRTEVLNGDLRQFHQSFNESPFMLPETQTLLDEAEIRCGKSIQVLMDRALPVSATIQIARHGVQHHILRVRPSDASDYFIANQVNFMLRLVELPAIQRYDFSCNDVGANAMAAILRSAPLAQGLVGLDGTSLADSLAKWALMQVRSIPVGMRVDQQVFRDMPALRTSLHAGMAEQTRGNLEAIQNAQGVIPLPEQYLWPAAAYALFADRLVGQSLYSIPFDAMGLTDGGRELLRLYDGTSSDPSSDRELVDAWARRIGVSEWYRWIPYQP